MGQKDAREHTDHDTRHQRRAGRGGGGSEAACPPCTPHTHNVFYSPPDQEASCSPRPACPRPSTLSLSDCPLAREPAIRLCTRCACVCVCRAGACRVTAVADRGRVAGWTQGAGGGSNKGVHRSVVSRTCWGRFSWGRFSRTCNRNGEPAYWVVVLPGGRPNAAAAPTSSFLPALPPPPPAPSSPGPSRCTPTSDLAAARLRPNSCVHTMAQMGRQRRGRRTGRRGSEETGSSKGEGQREEESQVADGRAQE